MKPEREGKGHGEGKRITLGSISETILNRKCVPGLSGSTAVGKGVRLPQMWESAWIPAEQWPISVRPMPSPGFRDGRDGPAQDPSAADEVVSCILSGVPG